MWNLAFGFGLTGFRFGACGLVLRGVLSVGSFAYLEFTTSGP